jgi:protein-S-isoprenylcysteine O-methyltransferase Ste14
MNREEEMLLDAFGEDYRVYKGKSWRLIPLIY